jgi:hypothetical protein
VVGASVGGSPVLYRQGPYDYEPPVIYNCSKKAA